MKGDESYKEEMWYEALHFPGLNTTWPKICPPLAFYLSTPFWAEIKSSWLLLLVTKIIFGRNLLFVCRNCFLFTGAKVVDTKYLFKDGNWVSGNITMNPLCWEILQDSPEWPSKLLLGDKQA